MKRTRHFPWRRLASGVALSLCAALLTLVAPPAPAAQAVLGGGIVVEPIGQPNFVAIGDACYDVRNIREWQIMRNAGCYFTSDRVDIFDTQGRWMGSGSFDITAWIFPQTKTGRWELTVLVEPVVGSFEGEPIQYSIGSICATSVGMSCSVLQTSPAVAPTGVTAPAKADMTWMFGTNPAAPGADLYTGAMVDIEYWSGPSTRAGTQINGYDMIRCDTVYQPAAGGCVIPWYDPILDYSTSTTVPEPTLGYLVPDIANHIKSSQGLGAPGKPGTSPLHYITDPNRKDRNRDESCPQNWPRPTGKECDEYPFASTYEGGYTGVLATASWVADYQNGWAGVLAGNFYRDNHLLDHDAFWVAIDRTLAPVVQDVAGGGAGGGQIGGPPPPNNPPLKAEPALIHDNDGSTMGIYRWTSTGTSFSRTTDYVSGSYHLSQVGDRVASGDVDGDGLSDIVLAYQKSDGTFQFNVILDGVRSDGAWYTSGPFSLDPVAGRLVVADFNGDGKAEPALVRDNGDGTMKIWRWLSTGSSFSRTTDYTSGPFHLESVGNRVAAGDVDGDGKADIVMAYQKSDGTFQYNVFPHGSGSGGAWYTSGPFSLDPVAGRLVVADFNGDGKAEPALVRDSGDGTMKIWRWLSTGSSFSRTTDYTSGPFHLAQVGDRVAAMDVTGDRKADIVMAYQEADGTFQYNVFPSGSGSDGVWYQSGPFNLQPVGGRLVLGRWDRD